MRMVLIPRYVRLHERNASDAELQQVRMLRLRMVLIYA